MKRDTFTSLSMYAIAIFLGLFLGNHQPIPIQLMYLTTTCVATFFARRQIRKELAEVTILPHIGSFADTTRLLFIDDSEELVVQAS